MATTIGRRTTTGAPSSPGLIQTVLAVCGVATPLVYVTTVFVAGLLRPGYSQIRQTISELGQVGTPNAFLQDANFVLFGLLMIPFALGLHRSVSTARGWIGPALLIVFGATIILQGTIFALPLTYQSNPVAAIGHNAAGIAGFIAVTLAIFVSSRNFGTDNRWRGYAVFSMAIGVALVALLIFNVAVGQRVFASWFGLLQRLEVTPYLLWIEVIAIKLLVLSVAPTSTTRSDRVSARRS